MPERGFNPQDPGQQEKIRRGPHAYVAAPGIHGHYVSLQMQSTAEYPKIMDSSRQPSRKNFKDDLEFSMAVAEWEQKLKDSIVNSREEEEAWKAAHEPKKGKIAQPVAV